MPDALTRAVEILLVENDDVQAELVRQGLRGGVRKHITVLPGGAEVLEYLARDGRRPDLVLLEPAVPRGWELLEELKNNLTWRSTPVVVLSASGAEADILRAYDLHANSYLVKPAERERYPRILQGIEAFWLTFVKMPFLE